MEGLGLSCDRQWEAGQGGSKAGLGLRFWCCLNPLVCFAGDSGMKSGLNEVCWPYIQKCRVMKLGKGLQDD